MRKLICLLLLAFVVNVCRSQIIYNDYELNPICGDPETFNCLLRFALEDFLSDKQFREYCKKDVVFMDYLPRNMFRVKEILEKHNVPIVVFDNPEIPKIPEKQIPLDSLVIKRMLARGMYVYYYDPVAWSEFADSISEQCFSAIEIPTPELKNENIIWTLNLKNIRRKGKRIIIENAPIYSRKYELKFIDYTTPDAGSDTEDQIPSIINDCLLDFLVKFDIKHPTIITDSFFYGFKFSEQIMHFNPKFETSFDFNSRSITPDDTKIYFGQFRGGCGSIIIVICSQDKFNKESYRCFYYYSYEPSKGKWVLDFENYVDKNDSWETKSY